MNVRMDIKELKRSGVNRRSFLGYGAVAAAAALAPR
jgi:hypothetical protein